MSPTFEINEPKAYGSMRVRSESNWRNFEAREPAIPPPITTTLRPFPDTDSVFSMSSRFKSKASRIFFNLSFDFLPYQSDLYTDTGLSWRRERGIKLNCVVYVLRWRQERRRRRRKDPDVVPWSYVITQVSQLIIILFQNIMGL